MSAHYATAAIAPIIKSPSLWLPRPVELPGDIHPLPDDISAYFVYPFTLEPHIIAQSDTMMTRLKQSKETSERYLRERREASERSKKDALHRIAPGYDPRASLVPLRPASSASQSTTAQQPRATITGGVAAGVQLGGAEGGHGSAGNDAGRKGSQSTDDMFNSLSL